jgi:UDP-N-acetylglucosamine 2-epimerase (non-hydrolysing)
LRRIAVFTGTRAEYGLLYWLLKDIEMDDSLNLKLIVSGSHLSPEFGLTVRQIEEDGFIIDEKVEMLLSSDSAIGTAKSIGLGVIGYADSLSRIKPDALVVLGDRFEALAIVQTALILRIPVVHLHGGEITEGAYDDAIRHAITKLSMYHCVSTEEHRLRVIQLGEEPRRVVNVGAVGLDHVQRSSLMSLKELSNSLGFDLTEAPYMVVTYHPVTLANEPAVASFNNLLAALDQFPNYRIILTYPNADDGGRAIIPLIEKYAAENPERVLAVPSLGFIRYLSAIKFSSVVVGNSSSGIIEVPSFCKPTVNIGNRQQGRRAALSVLNCGAVEREISEAIRSALKFENLDLIDNPYGQGDAASLIIELLKTIELKTEKTFYDLSQECLG